MKNNKVVIFFGILLTVLVVLLILVLNEKNSLKVVIMPGNNVFMVSNDELVQYHKDIKNKTKIKVNGDNRNLTFTYIKGEVKFYSGKEETIVNEEFGYAYTKGVNAKSLSYDTSNFSNEDIAELNKILKNHNISGYDNLSAQKVKYNNYTLYFVTNLFEEYTYDKVFTFVYYFNKDSDIIYLVEKVESTELIYNLCNPSVNSILNINNKINLVIKCDYYSEMGSDIYFYKFDNEIIKK